ncbi:SRPBCC domain-containing protein [Chryseobacterium sp.]|uniref:SRPBCC family protein n=1 Tax=Chryseobacterium sp. TaxID=1871047 RepID=UPI0028A23F8D|nr:SRPBCC domain-containing protein [Chryseobacterium sp.]
MENLVFDKVINAPKEKIWDILWNPATYGEWTKFFSPGSQMKTDWEVGGKTYFVNQEGEGMVSTIDSIEKPDQIVFKHLGMVDKEGNEDTQSKEVVEWNGAFEKYFLIGLEDGTVKLQAEVQIDSQWKEDMVNGFTQGLEVIKELSEKK